MKGVNLKQLEALVAVVEYNGFTEAASHLYITQSTISSHIKALEDTLGVELLSRGSRKNVTLTEAGKKAYLYANEIIGKCVALEEDLSEDAVKNLVIGASSVPSIGFLPGVISGFCKSNPNCCITVRAGDSEQIHNLLLKSEIQLGFVGTWGKGDALAYEKVAEDRLIMITPHTPRFVQLKAEGIYGRELLAEPMVFREQGSGTQSMIDHYLDEIGMDRKKMNVVACLANSEMLRNVVAAGAGVAIVSELSAKDMLSAGRVLPFELDERPVSRGIHMVRRRKGISTKLAEAFAAFVGEQAL